jgi:hypothetical protein
MENKYFTPDLEDIHVGYEGEVSYLHEDKFTPFKLRHAEETSDFLTGYYNRKVRTPFLTKEQIEKEGWIDQKDRDMSENMGFLFKSELGDIQYWTTNKRLNVSIKSTGYRFDGYCPSINEFRTIMKLLKL